MCFGDPSTNRKTISEADANDEYQGFDPTLLHLILATVNSLSRLANEKTNLVIPVPTMKPTSLKNQEWLKEERETATT